MATILENISFLPEMDPRRFRTALCVITFLTVSVHLLGGGAGITGEIFLVRKNGEPVPLADVEVLWFSQSEIEEFRVQGRKLGREFKQLAEEKAGAGARLKELAQGLIPEVQSQIDSAAAVLAAAKAKNEVFLKANGDIVSKIEFIKSEQIKLRMTLKGPLFDQINKLQLAKNAPSADEDMLRKAYGAKVVALFETMSANNRISYDEFAHTNDPAAIMRYITRREADSGKYNEAIRKAYSYSDKKLYFPGIYSKITAFAVERVRFHQILDEYLDAEVKSNGERASRRRAMDSDISGLQAEILRIDNEPFEFPKEVLEAFRTMEDLRKTELAMANDLERQKSMLWAIENGAYLDLPWSAVQLVEVRRLTDLLRENIRAIVAQRSDETVRQIESRMRLLYPYKVVTTDSRGSFGLPGDAGAVVAFYTNNVIAEGRTFAWIEAVRDSAGSVRLSHSNCIESEYRSITQCAQKLIFLAVTAGVGQEYDESKS